MVDLTPHRKRHVEKMIKNGKELLKTLMSEAPEEDMRTVLRIYQLHLSRALQRLQKPSG